MFIKSLNSVEVKESDAYPREVKEIAKLSICFYMVSSPQVIQCNQTDIEDYKEALKQFNKLKVEHPNDALYLMGTNPTTYICSYIPTYQFPPSCRPQTFAIDALNQLKVINLVNNTVQENDWLYTFGYNASKTQSKIKWLGTKESLRLFLTHWYEAELRKKAIKHKTIHELVPFCFVDKDEKQMFLAKAKQELGPIPDLIEKIFRPKCE